jgi:hypothetical protein
VSTDDCRRWRERLGAYLLGHLDPTEEAATRAHLDGCRECRQEAEQLRAVVDVLPLADAARLTEQPSPSADLGDRIVWRVVDERDRSRRRRRRTAGMAVGFAAAFVLLAGAVGLLARGGGDEPFEFQDLPVGVSAAATLEAKPWGTQIELDVAGLPEGQEYRVWLERPDGNRIPAGTFVAVPDREMHLVLAAGLDPASASGLGVSTPQGETIMYAEL